MLLTINKKLPRGIFLPTELFESALRINIKAPINHKKIPIILIKFTLFLKMKNDKMTTKIGEIIINMELLTGVE